MPRFLVCFAVPQEAHPFKTWARTRPNVEILITGMGEKNATSAVSASLVRARPDLVLTCGLAGGLNPAFTSGDVLYSTDTPSLNVSLRAAGARPARFVCTPKVLVAASEKQAMYHQTGADAVEMESGPVCELCRVAGVPSAIVRVILDTATQDLPIDFNQLLDEKQRLSYSRLALLLARSPGKIASLIQLQRQTALAAGALARVLQAAIAAV